MAKPHLCPKCHGEKVVAVNTGATTGITHRVCPLCNGDGVLWEQTEEKGSHFDPPMRKNT